MPFCPSCQRLTPAGAHHCPHCGAAQRLTDAVVQAQDSWRVRARQWRRNHAITGVAGGGLLTGANIGAGFEIAQAIIGGLFLGRIPAGGCVAWLRQRTPAGGDHGLARGA